MSTSPDAPGSAGDYVESPAHLRWRHAKDRLARHGVAVGGAAVLVSLALILVYLLIEVLPLFASPGATPRATYPVPGDASATRWIASEEQSEVGTRVTAAGQVYFFEIATGAVRRQLPLPVGERSVVSVVPVQADKDYLAALLSDGSVLPFKLTFAVTYPDNKRYIDPGLSFPHGETAQPFLSEPPLSLAVRDEGDTLLFAAADKDRRVHLRRVGSETDFLGNTTQSAPVDTVFQPAIPADLVLLNPGLEWLYVIDTQRGRVALHRLRAGADPELLSTEETGGAVAQASFLAGGISIVTARTDGHLTQWFPARREQADANGDAVWYLARVREFEAGEGVVALGAEMRRRVFAVGNADGSTALYHATAERHVMDVPSLGVPVQRLAFEPRADTLLALGEDRQLRVFTLHNPYPEVSWRSLWSKTWYESYDEPKYLWQSSAASNDFEPKFSLSPLTLGTLKGAFYAMIFAVPLAILGAIFTANFMTPRLRQVVKPTVEVMQALPTVVLGFLAGLWLAPLVEARLAAVLLSLLVLPVSIPVIGYGWARLPREIRAWVPPGWEAALMIPVLIAVVAFTFAVAEPFELAFFGGNLQGWMDQVLGIGYDQRNCLVVGIAMGVAVVPGIFSIAEDAIFSVPKQLTLGSLALGATPWQTLVGVVLPTASPGIFSAVMIGLGRAVGETMIVLMATGNTAVMDFSMFSGMRTLSANVAVEMPESEVGSTHFRLLFLAGLVLFAFTFILNTFAEVVRQRLRERYGNL